MSVSAGDHLPKRERSRRSWIAFRYLETDLDAGSSRIRSCVWQLCWAWQAVSVLATACAVAALLSPRVHFAFTPRLVS